MPKLEFVDEIPRVRTFRNTIPEWETLDAYAKHKSTKPVKVGEYDKPETAQHKANTLRVGQVKRYGKKLFQISTRSNVVYVVKL